MPGDRSPESFQATDRPPSAKEVVLTAEVDRLRAMLTQSKRYRERLQGKLAERDKRVDELREQIKHLGGTPG
jgi:hypothetical protein